MPRRNNGPRLKFLEKRGVYYIVWSEHGRSRERSTGTSDRARAEVELGRFIVDAQRAIGTVRDPNDYLITDALTDYVIDHGSDVMDKNRLAAAILKLTDHFEGVRVSAVNRNSCRAYSRWRNRAPGTVRRELTVLRAAINHAVGAGRLSRAVPVELPASPPPKATWLTRDEAARLLRAARSEPRVKHHLPLFILLGIYMGQRKEAILSLRWPKVDLGRGLIDYNLTNRRKTKKRRSHTQAPPGLLGHLRRARRKGSDLGFVVNEDGVALKDIKRGFASACKKAGLTGVTPHTLRHTCATWLMQQGAPKWEASGFLAMSLDTLERVYGHHHPNHHSEAANSFSNHRRAGKMS